MLLLALMLLLLALAPALGLMLELELELALALIRVLALALELELQLVLTENHGCPLGPCLLCGHPAHQRHREAKLLTLPTPPVPITQGLFGDTAPTQPMFTADSRPAFVAEHTIGCGPQLGWQASCAAWLRGACSRRSSAHFACARSRWMWRTLHAAHGCALRCATHSNDDEIMCGCTLLPCGCVDCGQVQRAGVQPPHVPRVHCRVHWRRGVRGPCVEPSMSSNK